MEIDASFHKNKIEYVPLFPGESEFHVQLNQISIEEEFIPIHDYYVLIDSGATSVIDIVLSPNF